MTVSLFLSFTIKKTSVKKSKAIHKSFTFASCLLLVLWRKICYTDNCPRQYVFANGQIIRAVFYVYEDTLLQRLYAQNVGLIHTIAKDAALPFMEFVMKATAMGIPIIHAYSLTIFSVRAHLPYFKRFGNGITTRQRANFRRIFIRTSRVRSTAIWNRT